MTRHFILLFTGCMLISGISSAQTREQIDSIRAEYLKALKKLPPPADPNLMKYRSQLHVPDTLHFSRVRPYAPQASPAIFETAYFKNTRTIEDSTNLDFYAIDVGEIDIETGKIIACDPIVMNAAEPFLQTFPTGTFPVQLAIATFNGDERVAFSRIYFSDKPVVRWEFALNSGKRQLPIDGDTLYGYGVNGGMGVFIDAKANEAFSDLHKLDDNLWNAVFTDEMNRHDHNTWQYTLFEFQTHNLACFSTGLGDGYYGTYVGYDKEGQICRLLTDFGLVRWWKK